MADMSVGPKVQRDASEPGCPGAVTFANPETGNAIARITRTAGGRPGTGLVPRVWAARAVRTRIRVISRLDCNPSASISCSSSSPFPTGRQPPAIHSAILVVDEKRCHRRILAAVPPPVRIGQRNDQRGGPHGHGNIRLCLLSKNSATIVPCPATRAPACSR